MRWNPGLYDRAREPQAFQAAEVHFQNGIHQAAAVGVVAAVVGHYRTFPEEEEAAEEGQFQILP